MTNTVGVLTTATGLSRNLTWHGDGVANNWDSQSTNWLNGTNSVTFSSGDAVTFDNTGSNSPAVNLVGALQPAAVTVAANQNYVFGGSGSLGGVMSLVKSGAGILTINTSNTFAGGVTVNAGTLQVNNPGGGATGPSQVFVASGATLSGSGAIGGLTAFDDGAILAPGNGAGTLTINNELDLSDLTVLQFGLGTNSDEVVVGGDLFASGIMNISDSGGFGPGSYTLFAYNPANTLSLGNLTFGTVPAGFHYRLDTNTPGQVNLIVTRQASPQFDIISLMGGNFVLTGTGGLSHGTYFVLTSTNIALPLSNWTRLFTSQFDASGNFNFTNAFDPNSPQAFYLLQLP